MVIISFFNCVFNIRFKEKYGFICITNLQLTIDGAHDEVSEKKIERNYSLLRVESRWRWQTIEIISI